MQPRPSILRKLFLAFLGFGLVMGMVFPVYAQFFVEYKPGMRLGFIAGCLVAGATIGVINYALVRLVLLRKLARIADVANAISHKDVTRRCVIESDDLIGEMVASFNGMCDTLQAMVQRIDAATEELSRASADLNGVTDGSRQRAEEQSAQTEEAGRDMTQMGEAIDAVTASAGEAAAAADEADRHSRSGTEALGEVAGAIRTLTTELEQAAATAEQLEADSEAVQQILEAIKGIAEQTNLLALNASIEAARAGENGRGFAVVADEVRSLAHRARQSTDEIEAILGRFGSGTREAAQAMTASRGRARETMEHTDAVVASLQTASEAVSTMREKNTHIAEVAHEQSALTARARRNIEASREGAAESAEAARRTAEAGKDLGRLAEQLRGLVREFRT
ncbi:MAG TPA: methyl-accepting chemotaxis protein [Gammaproteobacteria bacterium]|nr:methyl-accepting chemotaxis protein [Gammaproteobacteria bacterium]